LSTSELVVEDRVNDQNSDMNLRELDIKNPKNLPANIEIEGDIRKS
jgi:hypothetical protein